jgi:hypothetical protein
MHVCFDIPGTDRQAAMDRWLPVLAAKLSSLGINYEQLRLSQITGIFFPELRRIAEQIEFEFC